MNTACFWLGKGSYDYGDVVGHVNLSIVNGITGEVIPVMASLSLLAVPVASEKHMRALGEARKNTFFCGYKDGVEYGNYLVFSYMRSTYRGMAKALTILRLREKADHIRMLVSVPAHRESVTNGQMKVFEGCADIVSAQEAMHISALDRVTARTGFVEQMDAAFDEETLGLKFFFFNIVTKGTPHTEQPLSVDDGAGGKKKIIAERVTRKIRIRRT